MTGLLALYAILAAAYLAIVVALAFEEPDPMRAPDEPDFWTREVPS